jgi:hypothetical protein
VPAANIESTPAAVTTTAEQTPDKDTGGSGSNPNPNATDKMAAEPKGNEPSSEEKTETPLQGDNATTDASTAAERRTQPQFVVPARRGKGFGINNLRAMRDRSVQKPSDPDPDSSNNDTEADEDNNDDSKKDGKESDNEPTSGSTANVGEKAEANSNNDQRKVNDQKSNEATSKEPATEKTTTEVE